MQKKKNYNLHDGPKFQTYNAMKEQLEQENALLLRQRQNIQGKTKFTYGQTIPSQYTIIQQSGLSEQYDAQQYANSPLTYTKPKGQRAQAIYKKIQEVIDLCDEDSKTNANPNFKQVAEAERQLLKFLSSSNNLGLNKNQTSKLSKGKTSQIKIQKQTIRQQISQRGFAIGDDIMQMIEQIERKALTQIQSLRADKISLMKKLNEQMKAHNAERKKRAGFEARSNNLTYQLKRTAGSRRPQSPKIPNTIYEQQQQQYPTPGRAQFEQEDEEQYRQEQYQPQQQQPQQRPQSKQYQSQHQQQQQQSQHVSNPQTEYQAQTQSQHQRQASLSRQTQQKNQVTPQRNLNTKSVQSIQRGTGPISNQNIPNIQSVQYQDQQQARPKVVEVNSQIQIENEIVRLKQQNNQMRNTLSRHNSQAILPIKQQLRNELLQLQTKARQYEQLIANSRKTNTQTGFDSHQVESLLSQAANLAEEGQRLMRVRSKPEIRNLNGGMDLGYQYDNNAISGIRRPTKTSLDYEAPPSNQKMGKIYNQGGSSQFSPGDYERLLLEMKRATNS